METQWSAGSRSSVAVRSWGSVFCSCTSPTAKPRFDCGVAILALIYCIIYDDLSCNGTCVQRPIVHRLSDSDRTRISVASIAWLEQKEATLIGALALGAIAEAITGVLNPGAKESGI